MSIWYVDFPLYQYNEDVKELASVNKLKIIDARFQGIEVQCSNPPKITIKGSPEVEVETKPKRKKVNNGTNSISNN